MPGVVKVGQTERHPALRAIELSNVSCIPTPFAVVFFVEVSDVNRAAYLVHSTLSSVRVSSDREFFRSSVDEVERVIYGVASAYIPHSAARRPFMMQGDTLSLPRK
jgi:hypothetical protein